MPPGTPAPRPPGPDNMQQNPQLPLTIEVCSREKWNDTGIQVSAGETYRFEATGEWDDASHRCGPEGYDSPNFILRAAEKLRRVPNARWFALIGVVNHDLSTAFVIGQGVQQTFAASGPLSCFANDVSFMYWNNKGSVKLTITKIS